MLFTLVKTEMKECMGKKKNQTAKSRLLEEFVEL